MPQVQFRQREYKRRTRGCVLSFILRPVTSADVAVGHNGVPGERDSLFCDGIAEIAADAKPLLFDRCFGVKFDGRAEIHGFEPWRDIERYEGEAFSRAAVKKLCHVDEFILKFVKNVVLRQIMLGEDHHILPILQGRHRFLEGGKNAGVMIHTDAAGIGENEL